MTCAQFKGSKRIVLPLGLALSATHVSLSCRKPKQEQKKTVLVQHHQQFQDLQLPREKKMLSPLFSKGVAVATHSNTARYPSPTADLIAEVVYWPFPA